MKNILLIDYACHPFTLDLANELANEKTIVTYIFSKNINLTGDFYKTIKNPYLQIIPLKTTNFKKLNFFKRWKSEKEFGQRLISFIKNKNFSEIMLANVPIDPLNSITKYCKNNSIKTLFWVQDIYYLAIKNLLKKNIFYAFMSLIISKIYENLEKKIFLRVSRVILISENFKKYYPKRKKNVYVIHNWAPNIKKRLIKNKTLIQKELKIKNKFTFIYSGTLSLKHHFSNIIDLAINNKDAQILIFSNDFAIKNIREESTQFNLNNIFTHKLVSYDKLHKYLSISDVGLVNLNNESNNICVPSKILTYYTNGLPVLASMPLSNPASKNIIKFKTGLVSTPNNINKYLKHATILKSNRKLRMSLSKNSKNFAEENFSIKKISKNFLEILHDKI